MLKRVTNKTLDTQHTLKIKEFQTKQSTIDEKQEELGTLITSIQDITKTPLSNLSKSEFQEYLELSDKKNDLEREISKIRKSIDEVDYYIDTADIIFKYYDIVENGNVLDNENAQIVTENSILKFFSSSDNSKPEDENEKKDDDRASLLEKYMECTDGNYLKSVQQQECENCPVCDSKNRTLLVNDGLMYCNECYTIETVIIDHEKPSYKDPPKLWAVQSYWLVWLQNQATYLVAGKVLRYLLYFVSKLCRFGKSAGEAIICPFQRLNRYGVYTI